MQANNQVMQCGDSCRLSANPLIDILQTKSEGDQIMESVPGDGEVVTQGLLSRQLPSRLEFTQSLMSLNEQCLESDIHDISAVNAEVIQSISSDMSE